MAECLHEQVAIATTTTSTTTTTQTAQPRTLNPNPNLDPNPNPNHEQGRLGAALSAMAKAASTALEVLGANDRLTRGLRAKEATIAAELEKERRSKSGESSSDEDDSDRDDGGPAPDRDTSLTDKLSPEGLDALLRVLNRKNEELLVIFSNADLDHTSTIDKVEFALSLRSMGVRHVASIFEIMPVFGYTNGSSDVDLYELLLKVTLTLTPS